MLPCTSVDNDVSISKSHDKHDFIPRFIGSITIIVTKIVTQHATEIMLQLMMASSSTDDDAIITCNIISNAWNYQLELKL